jgi:hypothetical protein
MMVGAKRCRFASFLTNFNAAALSCLGWTSTRVQDMGGRRTPDNLGYYGFNESLNAYYEILSYTKIVTDAKKRNRILFEKLNLQ